MVAYYKELIKYAKEDLKKVGTFSFDGVIEQIKEKYPSAQYLEIKIEIRSPARDLADSLVEQGALNKNQKEALLRSMQTEINNAIASRFSNLQPVIRYPIFLGIENLAHSESIYGSDKIDILEFSAKCMDVSLVCKLLRLLSFEQLCFCKSVMVTTSDEHKTFFTVDIQRTPAKELYSEEEWTAIRKIFYEPAYLELISPYLYKEGRKAQITYECYRNYSIKKRRSIVLSDGSKTQLHEYLAPSTTSAEFGKVCDLNNIFALYAGTVGIDDEVLHAIIDIDVSKPLKIAFSEQLVWDLILSITEGVINACSKLGLGRNCAVNYSGSRGTHIIYSIEADALNNKEKIVNMREFLYQKLPGRRALVKNLKSAFRDKFKLLKTIVQAICLYSVAEGFVKVPREIKKRLKIQYPKNLFTLSTMPDDEMKVLLDSSPNGRGVFRVFGAHNKSKLMSRAIYSPQSRKIYEGFRNFETLKQECQVERVLEALKARDGQLFHEPGIVTKEQVRNLFKPYGLYPYVAILLRFGVESSLDFSPRGLNWWKRKYANESYFAYLKNEARIYRVDRTTARGFCDHAINLASRLNIRKRKWLNEALVKYFVDQNIEFATFENYIDAIRADDFHIGLMNLLENDVKASSSQHQFLAGNITDMFQITMLAIVNLRKMKPILLSQVKALYEFVREFTDLTEETKHFAACSEILSEERKKEIFLDISVRYNHMNKKFLKAFYQYENKKLKGK